MASPYKQHAIKIYGDGMGAAVIVRDILDSRLELNPEVRREVTSANSTPDHVAMVGQKNLFSFTTYDIKGVLDAIGVVGLGITSATNPGVVNYLQKFDDVGNAASGSSHRSYTLGDGLLVPKMLTCEHQGDFRLTCEMPLVWDGTNNPIVLSESAALPTITQVPNRWTLGKVIVGGVTLDRYTSISIDFGNNYATRGSESAVWDKSIEQITHEPSITITGIDPLWFKASSGIPIGGIVAANATDKVYLRKRTQDGNSFVGDGTSGHMLITPAGLASITQASQVVMQRLSETSLVIYGAKDSSGNMPLVLNTATTIT